MLSKTLFILYAFISLGAMAQTKTGNRLEFDNNEEFYNQRIHPIGENGFIICSESSEMAKKQIEFKYDHYNADLSILKSQSLHLPFKQVNVASFVGKEKMYDLYQDKKGGFSLAVIDLKTLDIKTTKGSFPKNAEIEKVLVLGDFFYGIINMPVKPILFTIHVETGKTEFHPLIVEAYPNSIKRIHDFQIPVNGNEAWLYIHVVTAPNKIELFAFKYNEEGLKEKEINLSHLIDKPIVSIRACKISETNYIYTGTYGAINTYQILTNTPQIEGLFFCKSKEQEVELLKCYSLFELKEFLYFLPEKKQDRLLQKRENEAEKGKKLMFNGGIAMHDLKIHGQDYLVLGEAYYSTYNNEENSLSFNGYQYTHAFLCRFNLQGELVWDKSMDMWLYEKPYEVKKFVTLTEKTDSSFQLAYATLHSIVSTQWTHTGDSIGNRVTQEIETELSGDKIKFGSSTLEHWYGHFYLVYGTQWIKSSEFNKSGRIVFFVNKVADNN